jgi:dienelactone hydrolase
MKTTADRRVRVALAALVVAALAVLGAASSSSDASVGRAAMIVAEDYDLGVRRFPQPGLTGSFARMPIRLWGTVAAPSSPGPHPVIVVAHGAHGDNCPGEYGTWPCWSREQRNDLGFRDLVKALAQKGFVAIALDVNAAYTGGWGEVAGREALRFRQVVDATLAELARANGGSTTRFGIPLRGKADLSTLGLLGHSRGGMNVLRWGKGKRAVRATFLVAPFHDPAQRIADVPSSVALGTCDGDTGLSGAKYVDGLRGKQRTAPTYQLTLAGANHNYYNQTLVRLRANDAPTGRAACRKGRQLRAPAQQAWLVRVSSDHFRFALLDEEPTVWMKPPPPKVVYGQRTSVVQLIP